MGAGWPGRGPHRGPRRRGSSALRPTPTSSLLVALLSRRGTRTRARGSSGGALMSACLLPAAAKPAASLPAWPSQSQPTQKETGRPLGPLSSPTQCSSNRRQTTASAKATRRDVRAPPGQPECCVCPAAHPAPHPPPQDRLDLQHPASSNPRGPQWSRSKPPCSDSERTSTSGGASSAEWVRGFAATPTPSPARPDQGPAPPHPAAACLLESRGIQRATSEAAAMQRRAAPPLRRPGQMSAEPHRAVRDGGWAGSLLGSRPLRALPPPRPGPPPSPA